MSSLEKILKLTGKLPPEPTAEELVLAGQQAVSELSVMLASDPTDDDDDDDGDDDSDGGKGDTDGDAGHTGHPLFKKLKGQGVPDAKAAAMCANADKKAKMSALCETATVALAAAQGQIKGTPAQAHPPFHGLHSHPHVHHGDNMHGGSPDRVPGHGYGAY